MSDDNHEAKRLELEIEEQRRDNDFVNHAYTEAGNRLVVFIGAALALLAYLFSSGNNPGATLQEKLFIPNEAYGVIIYFLALMSYLTCLVFLFFALRGRPWSTSYEGDRPDEFIPSEYIKYLKYTKYRYREIAKTNTESYSKRQAILDFTFTPLVLSAIILLLLKTFGG